MASNDKNNAHSAPISIPLNAARGRSRSMSVSSSSSGSTSSGSELPTPASTSIGSQRLSIPSPSTSPILSYFLAQSPTAKTPATATFPFKRKFGPTPVFEGILISGLHSESRSDNFLHKFRGRTRDRNTCSCSCSSCECKSLHPPKHSSHVL